MDNGDLSSKTPAEASENGTERPLNAESIAALEEAKRIANDPHAKSFKSAGDLMKDVLSDSD